MFQFQRLAELEQAQQLLVAKSDLQRGLVAAELSMLGRKLDWTEQLGNVGQRVKSGAPWLIPVAAVAGFLGWRGGGKLIRWVPTVLAVWRAVGPFLRKN